MGGRERENTRGRPRADKTTKQLERTFTSRAVAAGHDVESCSTFTATTPGLHLLPIPHVLCVYRPTLSNHNKLMLEYCTYLGRLLIRAQKNTTNYDSFGCLQLFQCLAKYKNVFRQLVIKHICIWLNIQTDKMYISPNILTLNRTQIQTLVFVHVKPLFITTYLLCEKI